MSGELIALGESASRADIRAASEAERTAIDQGMRASLLCALLGVEREGWVWPYRARVAAGGQRNPAVMLAGLYEPLDGIAELGTLAGAADLDPMDPGPSHTVLPATLAACIASPLVSSSNNGEEADREVASGVLAGVDAAWRVRRSISGARPGIGFHSAGVYGTLAAAAAAARILRLDATQCANALAIALTRASGLAVNSAASMIGMTHFGWGAAHGLEAALLAAEGWDASHDVARALASLYGEGNVNTAVLAATDGPATASGLVFKRYPVNIYLNLVVTMLDELREKPADRVEITMPWIPHLDCREPRDLRQARNSAQAAAAIAGAQAVSYSAFSGPPGPWVPAPEVARLLGNIELVTDRNAPTRLNEAVVGVRAWRGASLVQEATRAMRDMGGWGVAHARKLMGAEDPHGGVDALYGGSVLQGFAHVQRRRRARNAPTK
jgi:2-methylcitrate dehydratase PrpD